MNNLKKILALVVAVAMLASFGCVASAATYTDIASGASYADAVNLLSNLGIIQGFEDGTFRPDDTLTRAQAAAIMVRMLGLESAAVQGATQFNDVPATHWASGYVNVAATENIIKGYGDGNFLPEEAVTYEQIVKMIMVALGYEIAAEANGGYPSGYLYMASSTNTGVSKNAAGVVGEAASRATVAKLIYNALEVELMDQTSFSTGINGNSWQVLRGKTVLSEYLELEKIDGVVVDTYLSDHSYEDGDDTVDIVVTRNYGDLYSEVDYIAGESYPFVADNTDAATLLGYSVVAYVGENDDGEDEVFAISEKAGRNAVTVVDRESIDGVFNLGDEPVNSEIEGLKVGEVKYYRSDSSRTSTTAKITNQVASKIDLTAKNLVVNGFNDTAYTDKFVNENYLDPNGDDFSEVSLLDNNNDGDFEFVFVTLIDKNNSQEFVVGDVDLEENIINSADEKESLELDYDDENKLITIIRDGEIVNLDQIQADDVVTVLDTSSDVNVVTVYVSSNVVSGAIEEIEDDKEYKITIGGKDYKISEIQSEKETLLPKDFKPGDEGRFFINYAGKIADKDTVKSVSGANFVYVIDAGEITGDWPSDTVQALKVINESGKIESVPFKKTKVHIHADNYEASADYDAADAVGIVTTLLGDLYDWHVSDQPEGLIKIDTNAAGQITDVYVPSDKTDSTNDFTINTRYSNDADVESRSYSSARGTYGVFDVPTSAVVFNIDSTTKPGETIDLEEAVTVSTVGGVFVDDSSYSFKAFFENDDITAVLTTDAKTGFDPEAPVMVVTSNRKVSANDEETRRLTGIVAGETVTITVDPDEATVDVENIVPGNVIIYSKDATGFASNVTVLLNTTEDETSVAGATLSGYGNKIDVEPNEKSVNVAFGMVDTKERTYFTLADGKTRPETDEPCAYVAAEGGCNYTLVEFGRNLSVKASSASAVKESTQSYDIYVFVKTVDDSSEEVTDVVVFRVPK